MREEELRRQLQNEALLHVEPTMAMLHHSLIDDPGGSIYYGTGLTTPKAPSVGLPFDVLIFVLMAERLRRVLHLRDIHHHIADTHALKNPFCTREGVAAMTDEYCDVLRRIARVTGIPLTIHRSSEFDASSEYVALLERIRTDKGEYVQRELADILWYRERFGVRLKLGWLVQSTATEVGFDERLYDREFLTACDATMSFAYVSAGRTFDPKRMKVSPYIAVPDESRILFTRNEDARTKYDAAVSRWRGDRNLGGAVKHLNAILRLWDKISATPSPRGGDVIARVQGIIALVFA